MYYAFNFQKLMIQQSKISKNVNKLVTLQMKIVITVFKKIL